MPLRPLKPGAGVAPRGADPRAGNQVLDPEAHGRLEGVCAAVGTASASVAGRIRIGAMELYADLGQRAVLDTKALASTPSPMAGVGRRMLATPP